eukprot:jgi/Undpi1/7965/HiC_scaffold_24.g10437.m1
MSQQGSNDMYGSLAGASSYPSGKVGAVPSQEGEYTPSLESTNKRRCYDEKVQRVTSSLKKAKPSKAKSEVWAYFQMYASGQFSKYAICMICMRQKAYDKAEIKYSSSPSNLESPMAPGSAADPLRAFVRRSPASLEQGPTNARAIIAAADAASAAADSAVAFAADEERRRHAEKVYASSGLSEYAICRLCVHRKAYDKAEIKYSASPSNLLSHLKTGLPEHREAWEYLQRRKATAKLRLKAGAKTDAAGGGKGWGSGGRGLRGGRGGSGDGGGDGGGAGGGGDGYVFGLSEALEKSEGVKKKPLMMVSEYFPPKTPAWEQRLVRWMVQTAQPLSGRLSAT